MIRALSRCWSRSSKSRCVRLSQCANSTLASKTRRVWGVGTLANICVHYAAATAALRWYDVVIPGDAIFALDAFDVESSLRQTVFLFASAHPP